MKNKESKEGRESKYESQTNFFKNNQIQSDSLNQPITLSQLNKFKEDMLKQLKTIENNLYLENVDFKKEITIKLNTIESEITSTTSKSSTNNEYLNNSKLEKIDILEKAITKVQEESATQSLRIKNIDKSFNDKFYKYERLYLDNLQIPGLIGEYSKFKTFKDFIESTFNELDSFNVFKNKHTLDLKTYKEKLDNIVSLLDIQVSQIERGMKDYVNLKIEANEKMILKEKEALNEKIEDTRLLNVKYAKDLLLQAERLKNDQEFLSNFKEEVNNLINDNKNKMIILNKETVDSFVSVNNQFLQMKNKFNSIVEFIKDVRFRKNLDADIKKSETKELVKKIQYKNNYGNNFNESSQFIKKINNRSKSKSERILVKPNNEELNSDNEIDLNEEECFHNNDLVHDGNKKNLSVVRNNQNEYFDTSKEFNIDNKLNLLINSIEEQPNEENFPSSDHKILEELGTFKLKINSQEERLNEIESKLKISLFNGNIQSEILSKNQKHAHQNQSSSMNLNINGLSNIINNITNNVQSIQYNSKTIGSNINNQQYKTSESRTNLFNSTQNSNSNGNSINTSKALPSLSSSKNVIDYKQREREKKVISKEPKKSQSSIKRYSYTQNGFYKDKDADESKPHVVNLVFKNS